MPQAKLIAILRRSRDRAYSNWSHLWADGLEPISDFIEACAEEPRRIEAGWAPFWRYLEMGTYGKQLRHLGTFFPADQIHLIRYKSLVDEPRQTLDGICRFLGVARGSRRDSANEGGRFRLLAGSRSPRDDPQVWPSRCPAGDLLLVHRLCDNCLVRTGHHAEEIGQAERRTDDKAVLVSSNADT